MFSSEPQAVEVYQAGAWWAGELLGWRHLSDGSCQVQVRVVLGGVQETAWTDLAGLRLPERHLTVAAESADGPVTQALPRATPPRRSRAARAGSDGDVSATASMPLMRDLSVVGSAPRPGGRRRAPDTGEMAAVAPVAVSRPGGRRRAPETGEMPAVEARSGGRRRAPETGEMAAAVSPTSRPSGRRRAPETGEMHTVVPGRHRTADTGLFPPVTESAAARVVAAEPDLLTRPMRLSDQAPHSRRPRLDGSLTGV